MALIVLDDSTVGITPTPDGGFALQLREIVGLPEGFTILVPFSGGENADEVYDKIGEVLGKSPSRIMTATPSQAQQEAAQHGLDTTK